MNEDLSGKEGNNGRDEEEEEEEDEEENKSTITVLPTEIIIEVLKFLRFNKIFQISLTSRMWYASSLTDTLWKFHYLRQYPLPDPITQKFLNSKPKYMNILLQDYDEPFSPLSPQAYDDDEDESHSPQSPFFCEFAVGVWRSRFLQRYVMRQNFMRGRISKRLVIPNPTNDNIDCFERTPDKKFVICGTQKGYLVVFDTRKFETVLNIRCHRDRIREIIIFRKSEHQYVLTCGNDFVIQLREILQPPRTTNRFEMKEVARKTNRGEFGWYRCMQILPSSHPKKKNKFPAVITGDYRNIRFHRIHLQKSKIVTYRTLRDAHERAVLSLRVIQKEVVVSSSSVKYNPFSEKMKVVKSYLLSGGEDGRVYLWDISGGNVIRAMNGVGYYFSNLVLFPQQKVLENVVNMIVNHEEVSVNEEEEEEEEEKNKKSKVMYHDMIAISKEIMFLRTITEEEEGWGVNPGFHSEVIVPSTFFDEQSGDEEIPTAICCWDRDPNIFICGTERGNIYIFLRKLSQTNDYNDNDDDRTEMFKTSMKFLWKAQIMENPGIIREMKMFGDRLFCSVDRPIMPGSKKKFGYGCNALVIFHFHRKRTRGKLILEMKKI